MAGLSLTDFFVLKDLEQQSVETGFASLPGHGGDAANLLAGAYVTTPATDVFVLSDKGWNAAAKFRRWLANNRPGTIPPMPEPQSPDEIAEQIALARSIFAEQLTIPPGSVTIAQQADNAIQAAGVFITRRKAAGL